MWMNEAMKMWKMLFQVMKYFSVQNVFKLFITFQYFHRIIVCYSMNKCLFVKCTDPEETKGMSKQFD